MLLPKFLFVESPEMPGAGFILNSESPFYMAKVLKFNKPEDLEMFSMKSNSLFSLVPGYMIALQYFTVIGSKVSISIDQEDLKVCLNQMASYYLESKITPNKTYYKRNTL